MKTELQRHKDAIAAALTAVRSFGLDYRLIAEKVEAAVDAELNPPPEMETVELVRWECVSCGTIAKGAAGSCLPVQCGCGAVGNYVKLSGTITRPVPQKVEKSVSVEAIIDEDEMSAAGCCFTSPFIRSHPNTTGKAGTLTFTWEE